MGGQEMALEEIRANLLDSEALKTLDERIKQAYDQLVLGIGRVAALTEASIVQLRYWEKQGLVTPKETANGKNREYTLTDLKKLMWISGVLLPVNGAKPADLARLFQEVPEFPDLLDAILDYQPLGPVVAMPVEKSLKTITHDSFYQFLCPALAEIILNLLWKRLESDTGFFIPISREERSTLFENTDVNVALQSLGEGIFCFVDKSKAAHFWVQDPIFFQDPDDYQLKRMRIASDAFRVSMYALWRKGHSPPPEMDIDKMDADLADALARLLNLLLELAEKRKTISFPSVMYSSHTTSTDLTLSHLSMLVDHVVVQGHKDKPWTFCCFLAPDNSEDPRYQHTLTIIAQSRKSPHSLRARLEPREGISSFAYRTGQIVNVDFAEQEPRIARREVEETTESAIAVPIGCLDDSDAVLYVASSRPQAFTRSDELLLALLGHLAATKLLSNGLTKQQICTGRIQSIVSLEHPYTMDPRFRCFRTNDQFLRTIEEKIKHITEQGSRKGFALLAVDIDKSHDIWDEHRDEALLKDAWRWVGKVTQYTLRSELKSEVELYRIHVDRYAAIIDIEDDNQIFDLAKGMHDSLRPWPVHVSRSDWALPPIKFTTRFAIVLTKVEEVETLPMNYREIRQSLVHRLHSVLRFGKREGGNLIAYWGQDGPEQLDG
jgi:hypothetical protein